MQENSTVSMTTLIIRTLPFDTTVDQHPKLGQKVTAGWESTRFSSLRGRCATGDGLGGGPMTAKGGHGRDEARQVAKIVHRWNHQPCRERQSAVFGLR
jgi:hypothetical protein